MRPNSLLVLAFCSLILLAAPGLADEAKGNAEGPIAAIFAPTGCGTLTTGTSEPLFLAGCFVQVECADGLVKSCSGNSTCSTGGINNRCVFCDGVQVGDCCPLTCCEQCAADRAVCFDNCQTLHCPGCNFAYNRCVAGCTGGCS